MKLTIMYILLIIIQLEFAYFSGLVEEWIDKNKEGKNK